MTLHTFEGSVIYVTSGYAVSGLFYEVGTVGGFKIVIIIKNINFIFLHK